MAWQSCWVSTSSSNLLLASDASCLRQLLQCQLRPNVVTYGSLLSACERQQDSSKALEHLRSMRSSGIRPNVVVMSSAISACRPRWRTALELFRRMDREEIERDVITYNAAISSCREVAKAFGLFKEMKDNALRATVISFNALIGVCEKRGALRQGLRILQAMQGERLQSDSVSYNSLITCCARLARLQQAMSIFNNMPLGTRNGLAPLAEPPRTSLRVRPSDVTLSALCEACTAGKRGRLALTFRPWPPAVLPSALRALASAQLWRQALDAAHDLPLQGYNALLKACRMVPHVAWRLYDTMKSKLEPDVVSLTALAELHGSGRPWLLEALNQRAVQSLGNFNVSESDVLHL